MVKHHIKKKGHANAKAAVAKKKEEELASSLANIDRFAGSSDEEEDGDGDGDENDTYDEDRSLRNYDSDNSNGDSDNNDNDEELDMKIGSKKGSSKGMEGDDDDQSYVDDEGDGDDGGDDEGEEDDGESDAALSGGGMGFGMAGAMSKILASASSLSSSGKLKGNESLVLAKTRTKHQKVISKEEREERALKKKRKERRKRNLSVMHIPTLAGDPKGIENERTLRRIATRGVVALFNAISTHQHECKMDADEDDQKGGKDEKTSTKQGFIDKLKTGAMKEGEEEKKEVEEKKVEGKSKAKGKKGAVTKTDGSKWLQDDYLMKSKLKDWDKDDSDSSDEEEIRFVKDGEGDLEDAKEYDEKKRKEGEKMAAEERTEKNIAAKKRRKKK